MIKKLQITNYQSHRESVLNFHPGVNLIVGQSDSGKTAILRALKWLVWNRPLGDAFRSNWGGDTEVKLQTDNCRITRFKGKTDYYLLDPKGHGNKATDFKAFGTDPPEEIAQALNLSDINIQNQMDSAFLISNNPGQVSRHFNKVANLEQIDSSLKTVESWLRKERQNVEHVETNIEQYEKDLESFAWLDKLETDIEMLERLEQQKEKGWKQVSELSKHTSQVLEIEEKIKQDSEILKAEGDVDKVLNLIESRNQVRREFRALKQLYNTFSEVEESIEYNQALTEDEFLINQLLDLYNNKKGQDKAAKQLETLILSVYNIDMDITKIQDQLNEFEQTWHEHAPDTCPLCEGLGVLKND